MSYRQAHPGDEDMSESVKVRCSSINLKPPVSGSWSRSCPLSTESHITECTLVPHILRARVALVPASIPSQRIHSRFLTGPTASWNHRESSSIEMTFLPHGMAAGTFLHVLVNESSMMQCWEQYKDIRSFNRATFLNVFPRCTNKTFWALIEKATVRSMKVFMWCVTFRTISLSIFFLYLVKFRRTRFVFVFKGTFSFELNLFQKPLQFWLSSIQKDTCANTKTSFLVSSHLPSIDAESFYGEVISGSVSEGLYTDTTIRSRDVREKVFIAARTKKVKTISYVWTNNICERLTSRCSKRLYRIQIFFGVWEVHENSVI